MNFFLFFMSNKKSFFILFFFFIYLLIGLFIYQDYGISWDEFQQKKIGLTAYNYIFHNDPAFLTFRDRDYGVAFEIPLILIEKLLQIDQNYQQIFYMRHLFTFIFFYLGVLALYSQLYLFWQKRRWAILGSLLLILSPHIFSHSFYNSKDIALLSGFIICCYTLTLYLSRSNTVTLMIHIFSTSFIINIRIVGILIFIISLIILISKKQLKIFSIYFLSTLFLIVLFYPYLWSHPLENIIQLLSTLGKFRWEDKMLFMGKMILSTDIPWNYIPIWFGLTTPLVYLFLSTIGTSAIILDLIRKRAAIFYNWRIQISFIHLLLFLTPIGAAVILKPVLYDGWRHLFFIYGSFIFTVIYGTKYFFDKCRNHKIHFLFLSIFLIEIILIVNQLITSHPFQHIYFNHLMSVNTQKERMFELDYWGLSYRKGLEWILKNDARKSIDIMVETTPGVLNSFILPENERKRLNFVKNISDADYYLLNYRYQKSKFPHLLPLYSIVVDSCEILTIYCIKRCIKDDSLHPDR